MATSLNNNLENAANKVVSTVKMNCGCNLQANGSPAYVVESAIRHVQETGHIVDILGVIKPAVKKIKVYTPPVKSYRKEVEQPF